MSTRRIAVALAIGLLTATATVRAEEPSAPAAPVVETAAACPVAFIEHVYETAKPSVVRIRVPNGVGTGFVFHSTRHVATALHVVTLGREVRVEFASGKTMSATVVAVDREHDLAILELPEPAEAPPLVARPDVPIGSPILVIGNPFGGTSEHLPKFTGLLNFSVSQGIVSAKSVEYIQTDALVSPGNSGGPMLTCDGRVIAIADILLHSRIAFGVAVEHLVKLTQQIGGPTYHGRFALTAPTLGIAAQWDAHSYVGGYFGLTGRYRDRFSIMSRLALLYDGHTQANRGVVDRSVWRGFGELTLGYHLLFRSLATVPLSLTLGAGGLATFDRGGATRLSVRDGLLVGVRESIRGGGISPMAQGTLSVLGLEASYGYALDVIHPALSIHRFALGTQL